jgi:tellurite resistance protein
MAFIFGLVILVGFGFLLRALAAGSRAAVRSASGKGSFGANFEAAFSGMRPLEARLRAEQVTGEHSFLVQHIEAKGLFPVARERRLVFCASILDATEVGQDGKPQLQPVLCLFDRFQEPDTTCYGDRVDVGDVLPNYGWVDWLPILNIIPETLVSSRSGQRSFLVFVHAFDAAEPLTLRHGFVVEGKPLGTWRLAFSWKVVNEGYLERSEKQDRAEEGIIRLAVAVAFADGVMQNAEGATIKAWMARRLELLSGGDRDSRRKRLNSVMQQAYAKGKAGQLEVGSVVDELKAVAAPVVRTAAVELCLDVMSADGVAGDDELKVVNAVAKRLEVDLERFESLKDKRLVGIAANIRPDVDFYALLNIERSSNPEQIRTRLNQLYAQWNSRAESLHEPEQRAQAERMLEIIARARQSLRP